MSLPQPLLLYVNPAWRKTGMLHIPLLYPFWGNALNKERTPFQWQLFERHGFDTAYYSITDDIAAADAILMPYSHNHASKFAPDILALCVHSSKESGKPLVIDGIGDIEHSVTIPNTLVIRYGGYRFEKKENEIHIPPYADDLLEIYCASTLKMREKNKTPTISFAGWASLTNGQEMRARIKELPDRLRSLFVSHFAAKKKGVFFRREAVEVLKKSKEVAPHFLVRRSYSGHSDTAERSQQELRGEFVQNLLGSDYALDVRGDANASIRLFEILSLGRIPVIVDTERNLPFADTVDYASFALIVDFRDLKKLPRILADFHAKLSPEQFVAMQIAARDAYRNHFRIDALTAHLVGEIQKRLALVA
jgi:hypothetical protein